MSFYMVMKRPDSVQKVPKIFECTYCDYTTSRKSQYERHLATDKHKKTEKDQNPVPVVRDSYMCACCGFSTSHKTKYTKHLNTEKHRRLNTVENASLVPLETSKSDTMIYEILMKLATSTCALEAKVAELSHSNTINNTVNNTANTINANTTNNNNITVNMFLEQYCKDAITIQDFIQSIQTTNDDVLYLTKHGNKEGVTKIVTSALDQLAITERPIHCTDTKRHTTYIKDTEGWNKEKSQDYLKRLCNVTQHKCMKNAMEILESNPNYSINGTPEYEERIRMMAEVTTYANEDAILRHIEERSHLNKEIIQDAVIHL